MDADDFGPWIDHDGTGCPLPRGTHAEVQTSGLGIYSGVVGFGDHGTNSAWDWSIIDPAWKRKAVMKYRVRNLKAMRDLVQIAESVEDMVPA